MVLKSVRMVYLLARPHGAVVKLNIDTTIRFSCAIRPAVSQYAQARFAGRGQNCRCRVEHDWQRVGVVVPACVHRICRDTGTAVRRTVQRSSSADMFSAVSFTEAQPRAIVPGNRRLALGDLTESYRQCRLVLNTALPARQMTRLAISRPCMIPGPSITTADMDIRIILSQLQLASRREQHPQTPGKDGHYDSPRARTRSERTRPLVHDLSRPSPINDTFGRLGPPARKRAYA